MARALDVFIQTNAMPSGEVSQIMNIKGKIWNQSLFVFYYLYLILSQTMDNDDVSTDTF